MNYISQQAKANTALLPLIELVKPTSAAQIGLILTERLINIPSEVAPPMYRMLLEEISWAVEEKEPYTFSHYLILSKTYHEVASVLDLEESRPQKKVKQKKTSGEQGDANPFYFHPEDEVLQRYSSMVGSFDYAKQEGEGQSDAKRAFQELGIKPRGHMILIEATKFEASVQALEEYLQPS